MASSETELKAALYDLVGAAGNVERHHIGLATAEDTLHAGIRELAALRAWQDRAVPLLAALAYGGHEGAYIEAQARALLAESEAGDAD